MATPRWSYRRHADPERTSRHTMPHSEDALSAGSVRADGRAPNADVSEPSREQRNDEKRRLHEAQRKAKAIDRANDKRDKSRSKTEKNAKNKDKKEKKRK